LFKDSFVEWKTVDIAAWGGDNSSTLEKERASFHQRDWARASRCAPHPPTSVSPLLAASHQPLSSLIQEEAELSRRLDHIPQSALVSGRVEGEGLVTSSLSLSLSRLSLSPLSLSRTQTPTPLTRPCKAWSAGDPAGSASRPEPPGNCQREAPVPPGNCQREAPVRRYTQGFRPSTLNPEP